MLDFIEKTALAAMIKKHGREQMIAVIKGFESVEKKKGLEEKHQITKDDKKGGIP